MATVWMPLPDAGFDVTETAVPWRVLTAAGHRVLFSTERGGVPACDPLLLTGVLFGQLGAEAVPVALYAEMARSPGFVAPVPWDAVDLDAVDALLLPGGHAPEMRQYLGSEPLQARVGAFFATGKPVGAICHGTVLAARATDPRTGRSALHGRKTTCLPFYLERTAYFLTAWKLGRYYRTYDAYVEEEVRAALADPDRDFVRGPTSLVRRDSETDGSPGFVVEDGSYVSARWPGDAWTFGRAFAKRLPR